MVLKEVSNPLGYELTFLSGETWVSECIDVNANWLRGRRCRSGILIQTTIAFGNFGYPGNWRNICIEVW
jgi:hypothetical protein